MEQTSVSTSCPKNSLSDAKPAIKASAEYLHSSSQYLTFDQFKNIIVRLYGDVNPDGTTWMSADKFRNILNFILGEDGTDIALFSEVPAFKKKLIWVYDLQKEDGYIRCK
jgi:hypothetical protein